jgi:hypothetical protein
MSHQVPLSLTWKKARRSTADGACVEVASTGEMVAVRDSKNTCGPALIFTRSEWVSLLEGIKRADNIGRLGTDGLSADCRAGAC